MANEMTTCQFMQRLGDFQKDLRVLREEVTKRFPYGCVVKFSHLAGVEHWGICLGINYWPNEVPVVLPTGSVSYVDTLLLRRVDEPLQWPKEVQAYVPIFRAVPNPNAKNETES